MAILGASSNTVNVAINSKGDTKGITDTQNALGNFGNVAEGVKAKTVALGTALGTLAADAIKKVGEGLFEAGTAGFKFNSSVEQAETKLNAFMKDNVKVAQTLEWVKKEAAATQFSFTEMADAAANLTPVAKTSGKSLESLVKQAEILAALNPAEGLTGATFSLREALSGDWVSIVDRFNLPRKRINELKAQGVPAMEIISRTMSEMGIDFSLVEKQGQTVSARFDQVKDKLTMMAGAAAKPIFDRVSKELGKLGNVNFTDLGDKLAGIVSGSMKSVDDFIPKLQALGEKVWDYLGPKFGNLGRVIRDDLIPTLSDFWRNHIEPLMPVLGTGFVGAIGLAVDALTEFVGILDGTIQGISYVIEKLKEGDPVMWMLVGTLGVLGGAMALTAGFNAITAGFTVLTTTTIPAAMTAFGGLTALIAAPIFMPALVITAALASIAAVWDAYNKMMSAIDGAKKSREDFISMSKEMDKKYLAIVNDGVSSPEKKAAAQRVLDIQLPKARAGGGPVMAGGAYAVGDNPDGSWNDTTEMFVPKQSGNIINAKKLQSMMGGRGGGGTANITINNYSQVDYDKGIAKLGFKLAHL